jgi:hypothetical protein
MRLGGMKELTGQIEKLSPFRLDNPGNFSAIFQKMMSRS